MVRHALKNNTRCLAFRFIQETRRYQGDAIRLCKQLLIQRARDVNKDIYICFIDRQSAWQSPPSKASQGGLPSAVLVPSRWCWRITKTDIHNSAACDRFDKAIVKENADISYKLKQQSQNNFPRIYNVVLRMWPIFGLESFSRSSNAYTKKRLGVLSTIWKRYCGT